MANEDDIQPKRGWIAISRDIDRHWIWLDAKRFQMWIQMILWAQYQDGVVTIGSKSIRLRRGQFITSLKVLSGYMRCCKQTVITFLRVLESSKMIKREKFATHSVITIINYDKYQPTRNYKIPAFNRVETVNESDRSLDRKLDPIKERINKKEKKLYIETREKNLKFYQDLRESEDFWIKTSEALAIPVLSLKEDAERFFDEMLAKEDFREDFQEVRRYLFHWLKKRIESRPNPEHKKQKKADKNQNGTTETDNRRGVDAPTPSAETLSKGIF